MLALIPFEKGDFKPHEKSMDSLNIVTHIVEIIEGGGNGKLVSFEIN